MLSSSTPAPVNNTPPQVDAQVLYKKCVACHGKDGKTVAPGSVGNVLIASLNKAQVIEALKGFRAQTLSKGGNSVIMYMQTKNLTDEDIEALATYIDAL
ncbi:c-type cytochrome [Helicobacter sp. MIT 05-5293]|nr:c-type cytochrome [Helicobacter sp. MIT 05-5293]